MVQIVCNINKCCCRCELKDAFGQGRRKPVSINGNMYTQHETLEVIATQKRDWHQIQAIFT